ncbi:hypothetical protein NUH30_05685 [Leptospira sp. 85282-16]|uniref:hypothetical protein n=1 Tax=Leptospira sp. 85282-16 TaxID=2971256 RepID=UPI0021BEE72F|nr:hypothetical protein [Leptospira sp. 85282-16]MCT8333155.1 hypothetical protein [Leptospira sp. 85282-16]
MNYILERFLTKTAGLIITFSAEYFKINFTSSLYTNITFSVLLAVLIYGWFNLLRKKEKHNHSTFDFIFLNSPNLLHIKIPKASLTQDFLFSIVEFINNCKPEEVTFYFSETAEFSDSFKITKTENQLLLFFYSKKTNLDSFSKELNDHGIKTQVKLSLNQKIGNVQTSINDLFPQELNLMHLLIVKRLKGKSEYIIVNNSDIYIYNYLNKLFSN